MEKYFAYPCIAGIEPQCAWTIYRRGWFRNRAIGVICYTVEKRDEFLRHLNTPLC